MLGRRADIALFGVGAVTGGLPSHVYSAGYLDGATLTGDLNLSTTSSYVRFINGANFTGTNATFANSSHLRWQQRACQSR